MKRASAPGYDLFKLIVTLILLICLMFILLRGCTTGQVSVLVSETAEIKITETVGVSPMPATIEPATTMPEATPTTVPVETSSLAITPTPAELPLPASPTATGTSSLICNTRMPSRLSVGVSAQVTNNLNMRLAPEITAQILSTNPIGTQVEIIDGPVCTPKGDSAYLWWKIRLGTGSEGWSAETPLNNTDYFMAPLP